MLAPHLVRPAFVIASACNAFFAALAPFVDQGQWPAVIVPNWPVLIGGGLSVIAAITLGVMLLRDERTTDRAWIKAAVVLLALSPAAFILLAYGAAADTVCIGRGCYSEGALAFRARALGDLAQTHTAMFVVALVALFCAAKSMMMTLEELAA